MEEVYNTVKRTTHMVEGMFIDPFDNDNPSDHPLNFVSGVIKESLLKALDKRSQISINFFTKKHLIPSENNMPLKVMATTANIPSLTLKNRQKCKRQSAPN